MTDPKHAGVSDEEWRRATSSCHPLRVSRKIAETHDAVSLVFEIPPEHADTFGYVAGQFLSFKVPFAGRILVRSYSLASSPDTETEHKVTVKRVDGGRISNWMNDAVDVGSTLMVVPPAGLFVLRPDSVRDLTLFAGGSGITPCISILKTALATSDRRVRLVYANRDARSIIFEKEIDALLERYGDRLEVLHSLDDRDGFVTDLDVSRYVGPERDRDFYLCGPAAFMDTIEGALHDLRLAREQIHIERFISPPDHDGPVAVETVVSVPGQESGAPTAITVVIDGVEHEVPYEPGERVLAAARRAGLEPPFSCEEGYCSCCMAKLTAGEVHMATNDCLTPDLLEEGWVLTCQAQCSGKKVRIEYPD